MAYPDTPAVMDAVKAMMLGAGVTAVSFGWPGSPTAKVSGWVTLSGRGRGQDVGAMGGLVRRDVRLIGWLGYAVGTAPSTAETELAALADAIETAAYAARATNLDGACESVVFDFTLADNPDYLTLGGTERRIWPFGVNAKQSFTAPI